METMYKSRKMKNKWKKYKLLSGGDNTNVSYWILRSSKPQKSKML